MWRGVCRFKEFSMSLIKIKLVVVFILLAGSVFVVLSQRKSHVSNSRFTPAIPRVWDDAEMAQLQLPLIDSNASPKQISSDYYYRIPVRTIYKNYPVYEPGKEPAGYLEWLQDQEPQSTFDANALKTEADLAPCRRACIRLANFLRQHRTGRRC